MSHLGTILVFEDNRGDQKLIEEGLKAAEFQGKLEVVTDADAGLDWMDTRIAKNQPLPDIIILDLSLPKRSGTDILRSIRKNTRTKLIPVIIFTSSELPRDIHECYSEGASCYITKGNNIDQYFSAIKGMVDFWLGLCKIPQRVEYHRDSN